MSDRCPLGYLFKKSTVVGKVQYLIHSSILPGGMQGLQNMMRQFQSGAGGKMGNMGNMGNMFNNMDR